MKKKRMSCYFFEKAGRKFLCMWTFLFTLIIFLFTLFSLPGIAQEQVVELKLKDVSLYELFEAIRKQTGVRFLYDAEKMKDVPKLTIDVKNKKVKDVLKEALAGTPL